MNIAQASSIPTQFASTHSSPNTSAQHFHVCATRFLFSNSLRLGLLALTLFTAPALHAADYTAPATANSTLSGTVAGNNATFTNVQNPNTGNITVGTVTLGNITIGASTGRYFLDGGSITFNSGLSTLSSTLTHLATAQLGDTIESNFILNTNDLAIQALSTNPLTLNGTFTGSKNLTISGSGNLILNASIKTRYDDHVKVGNITITDTYVTLNTSGEGTGIYNEGGAFTLNKNATLNSTNTSDGFSIINEGGTLTLNDYAKLNSTNSNPEIVSSIAGSIYNESSTLSINNYATINSTNLGNQYGIFNYDSTLTINNNATLNSTNTGLGIGIYNYESFIILNDYTTLNSISSKGTSLSNTWGTITLNDNATLNSSTSNTGWGISNSGTITLSDYATLNSFNTGSNVGIENNGQSTLSLSDYATLNSSTSNTGEGIGNGGTITLRDYATLNSSNTGTGNSISSNSVGTISLSGNSTLINTGTGKGISNCGTLSLNDNARFLNDSLLTSTGTINISGSVLLAGNGTYNANLNSITATTRLSPGGSYNETTREIDPTIGAMHIQGAQSWSAFTYDWQLNAADPANYDTLNFDSALTLGGAYTLNLLALNSGSLSGDSYSWTLLSAASIANNAPGTWTLSNEAAFRSSLGLGSGTLSVLYDNNSVTLQYLAILNDYYWKETTTGLWSETAKWESAPGFAAAGKNIYLTRNQTGSTGTITIDQTTATIGNLTIGSESGRHIITGNSLTFDSGDGSLPTITHLATAQAGDTINSNLILSTNHLTIQALSTNPLIINGTFTGSKNLTISGSGNLILNASTKTRSDDHIKVGNITITDTYVTLNTSGEGTGIYNEGGAFTLNKNATINSTNTSDGFSIYNEGGTLTLNDYAKLNSTNSNPEIVSSIAGSILNESSTLSINNYATINSTNLGNQYGIFNYDSTLTINNNATLNSTNSDLGIGIYNYEATIILNDYATLNSTSSKGTGIISYSGTITINHNATLNSSSSNTGTGISTDGTLSLNDNATLNSYHSATGTGIGNGGTLSLSDNATLNSYNSGGTYSYGILTHGTFTISTGANATLNSTNTGTGIGILNNGNFTNSGNLTINLSGDRAFVNNATGSRNALTNTGNLTINGGGFTNNVANASANGIFNDGNITINGTAFNNNVTGGNGIYTHNSDGTITINNTGTFTNNVSVSIGIIAEDEAAITINNTATLINNASSGTGFSSSPGASITINNTSSFNNNVNGGIGIHAGNPYYAATDGSMTIDNTATFTNNVSSGKGIYADTGGSITINNTTTFTNNVTGGNGIHAAYGTITINNTTVFNNDVLDSNGIRAEQHGTITINNTKTFTNNAGGDSTAIYTEGSGDSITINNTAILTNNVTKGYGIQAVWGSTITINNTATLNNNLNGGLAGFHAEGSDSTITINNTTTFTNNVSKGAGIYADIGGSITINNTTTFNNDVSKGTGIYSTSNSDLIINNTTTFTNNVTGGNGIYSDYSNLALNDVVSFTNNVSGGNGIYARNSGIVTINNATTFINNVTGGYGLNVRYRMTVSNSTIDNIGSTTANAIFTEIGSTFSLENATTMTSTNSTIVNNGAFSIKDTSTLTLGTNAILVNLGTLTSSTAFAFTGTNQLLAGNGTYNANLNSITATTRLSPGGSYNETTRQIDPTIGTMNIQGVQAWSAFTYDWQINAATPSSYDTITFDSALTLGGTYTLNLLALNSGTLSDDSYNWTLLSAASITNNAIGTWTLANESAFRSALGLDSGTLSVLYENNSVLLRYNLSLLLSDYYWSPNTPSNTYNGTSTDWEENATPPADAAGSTIHFVRDQDTAVTIDLNGTQTIGNIVIGSENGTSTTFTLSNGTLSFDGNGNSSAISHHAKAKNDTISAAISLQNDLLIHVASDNSTSALTLSGDITGNNYSINKTGFGTLTTKSDINLGAGTFTLEQGHYGFDSGTITASRFTVKSGASIGANGTLTGDILFEAGAIITNQKRLGAKYNDRFDISGSATFDGNSAFYNLAEFNQVVNSLGNTPGRDNRIITDQTNTLFASSLTLAASATYTVNLYNSGAFDIQDWSIEKNDFGVYYSILVSNTAITNLDDTTWILKLMDGSGNAWDDTYWSIYKGEVGGIHGVWLHYSNPTRIPEPASTAALFAALALLGTFTLHRKRKQ